MANQILLERLTVFVLVLLCLISCTSCIFQAQQVEKQAAEAKKLKSSTRDIFKSSIDLDLNEAPLCSIVFKHESSFEQYEPVEVEKHIFLIPYEDGELADPYKGSDNVIGKTFNGSRVPPLAEIRCISLYLTKFKFVGVEALQFFHITNKRYVTETYGRYVHEITVEVLLTPSGTGEYVVHSIENSSLSKSVTVVSERQSAPYILGYGRTLQGEANDTTVVIPCIAAKYKTVIYLRYRADENYYLPIFNSGQSPLFGSVVRYDRRYGFILSIKNKSLLKQLLKGYWQADEFPFGEYKCETAESPDDSVVVFVKAVPDSSKDVANPKLAIDIKQCDGTGAVCAGPFGSTVNLTKYDIQRQEANEFLRCLAEGGPNPTCGTELASKEEGLSYTHISIISRLPDSGFLACSSDSGDVNHVFYFRGLSGTLYTQRWQDVPKSDLLRVRIVDYKDKEVELYPGATVYVYCDTAGQNIKPSLVYGKYKNNPLLVLKGQTNKYNGVWVELTSELEEVICNSLPWDSNMPITVSKQIILSEQNCSFSSNYFACNNGRCIENYQLCNAEDDCGDNSDEELDECKEKYFENAPKITNKQDLERNVLRKEFYSLTCLVSVKYLGQDPELLQWVNNDGEINSGYEINEISKSYESVFIYTLTFNATKDDEYTCIARNRFGNDSATYRISTQGACSSNSANINCPTVPAQPPGPIQHPVPTPRPIVEVPADEPQAVPMPQPFTCTSEGKFPDPYNCGIYHECVADRANGGYSNYQFTCGIETVYCPETQICGYEHQCPCAANRNRIRNKQMMMEMQYQNDHRHRS